MRPPTDYNITIYDCDGVIFDSNSLKVDAMRKALQGVAKFPAAEIDSCVSYFANNFGRSRYVTIRHFVDEILTLDPSSAINYYEVLLEKYSDACRMLYLEADVAPDFINYIESLTGRKYVASGSAQDELRWVFERRDLQKYFSGIFGSPTKKSEIVANIVLKAQHKNIVLIGDAVSDFQASVENEIDFCYYGRYSLVNDTMLALAAEHGFPVITDF